MDVPTYSAVRTPLVVRTDAEATTAVHAGVHLLDCRLPAGWRRLLTRPIHVESHVWCPLSQVFTRPFKLFSQRYPQALSAYRYGLYELGFWETGDETHFGFDAADRAAALLLDAAWASVVQR